MKQGSPNDSAKKRELLRYGVGAFAITVIVVVMSRVTGHLDWSTVGRDIILAALGDGATCIFWWRFRD